MMRPCQMQGNGKNAFLSGTFAVQFKHLLFTMLLFLPSAALFAQNWSYDASGNPYTGKIVAIGDGIQPFVYATLRLAPPVGASDSPCSSFPVEPYKCLQLSFGNSSATYFGLRLDASHNLRLSQQADAGWFDGVTFYRAGDVAISGSNVPLRLDTSSSGGFGVQFSDLHIVPQTGFELNMDGNSFINVSNLRLGYLGIPLVQSTTASPLYLNYSAQTNVVVGNPDSPSSSVGLRVEGSGQSTFRGSVGIGTVTPNPAYRLDVAGDANFSGTVSGGNIQAQFQDVAEWVPSDTHLPAGTVVVLDPASSNHVVASSRAYDTSVAGVVSGRPGITLGEASDSKSLIATTGRVRVRVDASRQPIAIGDLLVTGDRPGTAMKSVPLDLQGIAIHRPGTVLGKALEPLSHGESEILVLLSLQ